MNWMTAPSAPGARDIATLTWIASLAFAAVCLVVWIVLAYLIARRTRGTLGEHMPHTTKSGMGWVYVWGLAIPGVLFGASLVASIVLMFAASEHMHDHHRRPDLEITGHQWWWEVRYLGDSADDAFVTANEIHIPVGRPVLVRLRSADVIHSFWVPELGGKVDLVPGRDNMIMLHADRPGRFDGQCAEFCGAEHAMMRIVVVAEPEVQYQAWRVMQRAPSVAARSEPQLQGQVVFETRACGVCHTVRGTHALGTVGPDLTHIGSRQMIGAGAYPNDRAHLQAWIVRPHALKPQILMPNIYDLTGDEINALAMYLGSLQ